MLPVSFKLIGARTSADFLTRELKLSDDSPTVLIGRSSKNRADAVPKFNNALFDCPVISRRHAELKLAENRTIKITDLASLHGTALNSVKLPAKKEYVVNDGDLVTIGNRITLGTRKPQNLRCSAQAHSQSEQYHEIVFQVRIQVNRSEVIDLSSPISSPKLAPRPSVTPVWATAKSSAPCMTRPTNSNHAYAVPDDDDDSAASDVDSVIEAGAPDAHKETNSPGSVHDKSAGEPSSVPLPKVSAQEQARQLSPTSPDPMDDPSEMNSVYSSDAEDAQGTQESQGDVDSCLEDEESDNPVYTPTSSGSASSRSCSPTFDDITDDAGEALPKADGFYSRILSEDESALACDKPAETQQASSMHLAKTPPPPSAAPVNASQINPMAPWSQSAAPGNIDTQTPNAHSYTSPFQSCTSQLPSSQTAAEESPRYPRPPPYAASQPFPSVAPPPRPFLPLAASQTQNVSYRHGLGSPSEPPLNFNQTFNTPAGHRNWSYRRPIPVPYSTWTPPPNEPNPFFPVHGVPHAPLSLSPWDTPLSASSARNLGACAASSSMKSSQPLDGLMRPLHPSVGSTDAPSARPQSGNVDRVSAGEHTDAGANKDQSRMSIHHVISNASDDVPAESAGQGSEPHDDVPSSPSTGDKRKFDDATTDKTEDPKVIVQEELPEPLIAEQSASEQPASVANPESEEPPTKRTRTALQQLSTDDPAPRNGSSYAHNVAKVAAKYTLAGAVGGMLALGGLLALPGSLFP
ncbi:MAG: hypothetical protein Q9162_004329 [Coniocarpon cinnabarinum]